MNASRSTPALIAWPGYVAITLLLVLPLSVLMVRSGAWQQGLLLFAIACLGSAAVFALMLVLVVLPGFAAQRPVILRRGLLALPGTLLLAALLSGGGDSPMIHDVTTDPLDPPLFSEAALARRGAGSNGLEPDSEALRQQLEAYPDLATLVTPMPIDEAFDLAQETAAALGWEVYFRDPNLGVIEAVDTTPIMAFRDDIVIRLRTNADGTLVDLRSVSRVGEGDLGANAERIQRFLDQFRRREEASLR